MQYKIFSIYDRKSKIYHNPVFCINVATALRMHTIIFSDENSMFNRFPDDFQLYEFGSFENTDGKLTLHSQPTYVCCAEDLLQTKKGVDKNENENTEARQWLKESDSKAVNQDDDGAAA